MTRQCMRPGCDRPVAACLTYDTEAVSVWLDNPRTDGQPAQQVCSVHAATLTAPLGWTVTDRRVSNGASSSERSAGRTGTSVTQGSRQDVTFEDGSEDPVQPAPQQQRSATERTAPARPAKERSAPAAKDGGGSGMPKGKPRGKLLDRAFEWTGPQHSVLTTGNAPADPEHPDDAD